MRPCINFIFCTFSMEGAEADVMEDLIAYDLLKYFDGFYGMWDDVSKIDQEKDRVFRGLLKAW